ncbi:Histidinol-phosphate aminotransferase [Candidatus Hodgkinia cicadicola]|uniref:Histidinol-phosphate aminotransferase n=1 Tax=Candidatus Hodgkinia cicadicola TaxID=573658 RepID=A0ABX4MJV2_9HYPH|nr:Histidinol-phosphate aminotransferase [Candidatus Hodgkinia cicadicola]
MFQSYYVQYSRIQQPPVRISLCPYRYLLSLPSPSNLPFLLIYKQQEVMVLNFITKYQPGLQRSLVNSQKLVTYKLSSNENPLGTSKLTRIGLQIGYDKLERYPNNVPTKLINSIANIYNLNSKRIILGNGSDEFLNLLCLVCLKPEDEVIISEHGFLLYRTQVLAARSIPVIIKDSDNKLNINNIIRAINSKTKIVFITIPTNPTGLFLTIRETNQLANLLNTVNIILILDMAYSEYVGDDRYSIESFTNAIIIKTLSKIYGLASLRLGWMYGNKKITTLIEKVKSPFNINRMAGIGGIIALGDKQQCKLSKSFNGFWLIKVISSLRKAGFVVAKSYTNFVLIKFIKKLPIQLIETYISTCGLNIRSISEYKLFNSIRISIGLPDANIMLINQLKKMRKQRFVLVTHKTDESLKQFWKTIE